MIVFASQITEKKNIYLLDDAGQTLSRNQVTLYPILNSRWSKALIVRDKSMKLMKKI